MSNDGVVFSDFGRIVEQNAISTTSQKGKWWLRSYRTADGSSGKMLCVEQRDMDNPQSCVAPPITLDLDVSGMYQVWIGTVRPRFGGGIDVRVSDENYFRHLDPQQVSKVTADELDSGGIVEMLFHEAIDLTGRSLVFQQPYGTYQSLYWGHCAAHLAYVRLVPLNDDDIRSLDARASKPKLPYGFDCDGFSYFWKWGTEDPQCLERLVEPLRHSDASFWSFCIGNHGRHRWFDTPGFDPCITKPEPGVRLGDHREFRVRQALKSHYGENGGVVKALIRRTHELGKEIFLSQRMSSGVVDGLVYQSHPQWRLVRRPYCWDYAQAEVRDLTHDTLCWVAENFDADGIVLDFSRLAECLSLIHI